MLLPDGGEEVLDRLVVAVVDDHGDACPAGRVDQGGCLGDGSPVRRVGGRPAAAGHVDGRPLAAQCFSDTPAGSSARAGDDGHNWVAAR